MPSQIPLTPTVAVHRFDGDYGKGRKAGKQINNSVWMRKKNNNNKGKKENLNKNGETRSVTLKVTSTPTSHTIKGGSSSSQLLLQFHFIHRILQFFFLSKRNFVLFVWQLICRVPDWRASESDSLARSDLSIPPSFLHSQSGWCVCVCCVFFIILCVCLLCYGGLFCFFLRE